MIRTRTICILTALPLMAPGAAGRKGGNLMRTETFIHAYGMVFVIVAAAAIAISLIFVVPARAGVLPDLGGADHYSTFLYGGWAGQEVWYEFREDMGGEGAGDRAGTVLGLPGQIPGLEPLALYGWYRYRGDVAGDLPDEAHDFTLGTVYAIDVTPGAFVPYFAFEQVTWTSGPEIDRGYYGLGVEWRPSATLSLDGTIWHDGTDAYRLTGVVEAIIGSSSIEAMAWCVIDADDPWGLWRATLRHPLGDDMDAVAVYEGSTRSRGALMIGIGMRF